MSNEAQVLSGVGLVRVSQLAAQLRVDSIRCSTSAGSGHPTSQHVRGGPAGRAGQPAPALRLGPPAAADQRPPHLLQGPRLAAAVLGVQGRRRGLRRGADDRVPAVRSRAWRAIPPRCCPGSTWPPARWARDCPTGSGSRWPASTSTGCPYRVWVLCGDSEMAEGSIWEALDKASYYQLSNLIAIVDVNRLGQRGPDRAAVGPRHLRPPRRGVRRPGAGHRRPRPRRDRRGVHRRRATGPAASPR